MKQYRISETLDHDGLNRLFIPQLSENGGMNWINIHTGFRNIDQAKQFIDNHGSSVRIHEYSPGTSNKQILND